MALTMVWNGIERSLSDWGIDPATATLTLRAFSADVFSFQVNCLDAFAARTLTYGDDIVLKQDGTPIFIGHLRDRPVVAEAAERQQYTATNFWAELDALIYEQQRNVIDAEFVNLNLVATTQVLFGRNTANGAKIDTKTQIQNLLTFAAANGVTVAQDVDFTGLTAPWEQATDVSVASGLRRMMAWQPDISGRAEYGTGTPVLRLRRPNEDDVNIIDLTAANLVTSIRCKRKDEMRPNGVVIYFITTEVNAASGASYVRVTKQTGGPYQTGPYVIKATIPIGTAETIPASLAANYYASLATVFLEGQIAIKGVEISQTIKPGQLLNFTHGLAEWDSCFAPVNEVVHQLGSGVSVASFGPPPFLPASSFAALNGKLKPPPPPPTPPPDGGNDGTGDADTGRGGAGGPTSGATFPLDTCEGGSTVPRHVYGT